MTGLGGDVMGGMRNVETWAYENEAVLGSCPSVPPKIPSVLALYPLIYTSV